MVNIAPRSAGGPVTDDPSWIGSDHGQNMNLTVTLDLSAFTAATHFPDGFLKSGTPLAKITASGLYGPYDGDAEDGTETLVGFLYSPLTVTDGFGTLERVSGAAYTHGNVVEDRLPIAVDEAAKASVAGLIQFI